MSTETDLQHEGESTGVEVKASFRVMGASLEPAEVSCLLDLEPAKAHARGDANLGESGRRYSDFSEGLWTWRPALAETEPVAAHLNALLDALEPKAPVLQRLKGMGLRMDLFVGVFRADTNIGFVLDPTLLARLGKLGIDLDFDVYCC